MTNIVCDDVIFFKYFTDSPSSSLNIAGDDVREQLSDAAAYTNTAYAIARRNRHSERDIELGTTRASLEYPGEDSGSTVTANEFLKVKPLMRFLQLLCENHNYDLQVSFVAFFCREYQ